MRKNTFQDGLSWVVSRFGNPRGASIRETTVYTKLKPVLIETNCQFYEARAR